MSLSGDAVAKTKGSYPSGVLTRHERQESGLTSDRCTQTSVLPPAPVVHGKLYFRMDGWGTSHRAPTWGGTSVPREEVVGPGENVEEDPGLWEPQVAPPTNVVPRVLVR